MGWGVILLPIVGLFILYVVIFTAVRDGIDRSELGKLIIKRFEGKEEVKPVSDDEIEKELEDEFKIQK